MKYYLTIWAHWVLSHSNTYMRYHIRQRLANRTELLASDWYVWSVLTSGIKSDARVDYDRMIHDFMQDIDNDRSRLVTLRKQRWSYRVASWWKNRVEYGR